MAPPAILLAVGRGLWERQKRGGSRVTWPVECNKGHASGRRGGRSCVVRADVVMMSCTCSAMNPNQQWTTFVSEVHPWWDMCYACQCSSIGKDQTEICEPRGLVRGEGHVAIDVVLGQYTCGFQDLNRFSTDHNLEGHSVIENKEQ